MAFDVEGYRKAAKEAGLSDEEIQKDIDEETKGIAAKGADADMANVKVGKDFMGVPEWLQPALGLAAAAGIGGLGLKAAEGIKGRMNTPEQPSAARVEPTFGIPDVEAAAQQQNKFTPPQGDVTDVASRPVGEPRLQIGGPRALPAPEVAVPTATAPAPAPAPTAPTAPVAEAPVAPPAAAAPAAVAPKPVDPLVQAKLDAIAADQRRKDEAHAAEQRRKDEAHSTRMAKNAQSSEVKNQASQGKPVDNIETTIQKQSHANSITKANDALVDVEKSKQVAAKKAAPVGSVQPTAPVVSTPAQAPTTVAEVQAAGPAIGTNQEVVKASTPAPTEVKGAKAPKWPGGAEGSAIQLFGGTKKNFTPESQAAVEMFKDYVGSTLSIPPTGGTIHQIPEASKFYEKYTGSPLPRSPEGKLMRIPEEQMQKLHGGIRSELEDAVKGGKLGNLGKGAMAAAALLGLSGAVQAAQKGDFGPLRQAGFDIGGPIALGKVGLTALSRAGGAGFTAATYSGNLNEGEQQELARRRHDYMMKESQKLGSPYRSVPPPR